MRSLFLNIKDKGNPGLRNEIVLGQVTPDKVVRMSKEEMASESVRLLNEKLAEKNLFKAKAVGVTQVSERRSARCSTRVQEERSEMFRITALQGASTRRNSPGVIGYDQGYADRIQAETDAFKCSRCQQRKCTYYQMQTRSADEPMTVSGRVFMRFGEFGRLTSRPS